MEVLANGSVHLHVGDCVEVLATLPECSVDAVVTDPPYHLTSVVKRFGAENAAPAQFGTDGVYARSSAGFMGQRWDGGDVAFRASTWAAVLRVLRPGGHLIAFSGTRTYHRMVCAIEDAGFECREMLAWLFGSGFPKNLNASKQIDRMLGAEREKVRHQPRLETSGTFCGSMDTRPWIEKSREVGYHEGDCDTPATWAARQWEGWGSALKPAMNPICLARKPLEGTLAKNVIRHGTGALNIDGARVGTDQMKVTVSDGTFKSTNGSMSGHNIGRIDCGAKEGRWPANVMHDGSPEVTAAFPETTPSNVRISEDRDIAQSTWSLNRQGTTPRGMSDNRGSAARFFASFNGRDGEASARRRYIDEGATDFAALPGARRDGTAPSRLFYQAKADFDDRLGSRHPTVKPLDLIQYLVRLITPPKVIEFVCETCAKPPSEERKKHVSSQVQTVQDVVQVSSEEPISVLSRMSVSLGDDSPGKLQDMQQADREVPSDLLFTRMPSGRIPSNQNATSAPMRILQDGVQAKKGRRQAVLFEDMCGQMDWIVEAEKNKISSRLYFNDGPGKCDGNESGLRDGTSSSDGRTYRTATIADGSGSSHQRQEGRQQDRKPPVDDTRCSQRFAESDNKDCDQVSQLRDGPSVVKHCPACGDILVAKERQGVVLDPFAGTGTTAEAALREGMRAILIEREEQYCEDIRRRMRLWLGGPDERRHASLKARGLVESPGPLFDGWPEAAE